MKNKAKISKSELTGVLVAIKREAVKYDWYNEERDVQITVGYCDKKADWDIQTGDNGFTGRAYSYPNWGVSSIYPGCNCKEIAAELINQIEELIA